MQWLQAGFSAIAADFSPTAIRMVGSSMPGPLMTNIASTTITKMPKMLHLRPGSWLVVRGCRPIFDWSNGICDIGCQDIWTVDPSDSMASMDLMLQLPNNYTSRFLGIESLQADMRNNAVPAISDHKDTRREKNGAIHRFHPFPLLH